jgi:hypothetical protein
MTSSEYRLGRSLVQIVPFYRSIQRKQQELITTKLLIVMAIVVGVKIAVLLLWI